MNGWWLALIVVGAPAFTWVLYGFKDLGLILITWGGFWGVLFFLSAISEAS